MNILTLENVSKSYTERILLNKVSLGIHEGDKIGVLGINGTGKSTLLKLIAGYEEPDSGEIIKGNHIKIEYLPQKSDYYKDDTVLNYVLNETAIEEKDWEREANAKKLLNAVGFNEYDIKLSILSGGQKKRVSLIRSILNPADILILDEPTNHLDSSMAEWLEEYLNQYAKTLIMVTHDRYFLDHVVNKMIEIDKGSLYTYQGNYSDYLQKKAQREESMLASERKKQSLYRMDLEWMLRGARARSTKQKAHIKRFEELKNRERIEEEQKVQMESVSSRLGKKTLSVEEISKAYDQNILFKQFSYTFLKEDRIGIVGSNGCGKTTLLKVLTGRLEPDTGTVEYGQTIKIGYFSQENEELDETKKVIDYMKESGEYVQTKTGSISASAMLERFLFDGGMQYSQIEKLSGGERRRLTLLKILMEAPNILILDEPTNDLDTKTLSILEEYLDSFQGIVITVSHDRYFLDRVVKRIFAFEADGRIKQYEGGYSDYYVSKPEKKTTEGEKKKNTEYKSSKVKSTKLKFTYKEAREYEVIDEVIEKLEEQQKELAQSIEENARDYNKLNELLAKKDEVEKELESQMNRWEYLTDLADQIEQLNKKDI